MKLTAEQFTQFGAETQRMLKVSRWRCGQAMFNALAWICPTLAAEVRGTELDPFYQNERIGAFMKHILEPEQYDRLQPTFKMPEDRPLRNPLVEDFAKTL